MFGAHEARLSGAQRQAAAFHSQFVQALAAARRLRRRGGPPNLAPCSRYSTSSTRPPLALLNRPLIGNGSRWDRGEPQRQAGGLLIGNGGNGLSPACRPRRQRRRRRTAGPRRQRRRGAPLGANGGAGGTGGWLFGNGGPAGNSGGGWRCRPASAAPPCSSGPAGAGGHQPQGMEPVALEATAGCFLATAVQAPAASRRRWRRRQGLPVRRRGAAGQPIRG
ncbi:hypothetical protein [Mycobacterium tuberculosis]|uniref:hypothetical protein n=1 Tax=Mycobacterium tuberculosis TaxID=1773 RepID=UPI0034577ABD